MDTQQHHCYGCRHGGGVDRRHAAVGRCLADVFQSHSGVKVFIEQEVPALTCVAVARCLADVIHSQSGTKVFIEQEVPALTRVVNGQREHAYMDLVFNLNGCHILGCL